MQSAHIPVQKGPSVDVPKADSEVNGPGHQMGHVVAGVVVVGVEQAVDPTSVAHQDLMLRPIGVPLVFSRQQVKHDGLCGRDHDNGAVLTTANQPALTWQIYCGRKFDVGLEKKQVKPGFTNHQPRLVSKKNSTEL